MKKLKKIELSKINLNPDAKLTDNDMHDLNGGAGCICYVNAFNVNGTCACWQNAFGLCSNVNGGGTPGTSGRS